MTGLVVTRPPEGFESIEIGSAVAWVRPPARKWVRSVLDRSGSLYSEARAAAGGRSTLHGRAALFEVPTGAGSWVVKHYVRGGAVASLLGDRYLASRRPRPFVEVAASEWLRERAIATPSVVAAVVYWGRLLYRGDLAIERLPGTRDLGELLFAEGPGPSSPELRAGALEAAGSLVRSLAKAGVRHGDLNTKNILVDVEASPPGVHVLDLDRCALTRWGPGAERWMRYRLLHSLAAWERSSGRPLAPKEREALARGLAGR